QSSVYFDTPDKQLRTRGLMLRVRKVDGRFIQTLKAIGDGAGLFQRGEWEYEIDRPEPDPTKLSHTPLANFDATDLEPVVHSEVRRTSCRLHQDDGEIELAFDEGLTRVGCGEAPLSEIEIELIHGEPRALLGLARLITQSVPAKLGVMSKAERGFALAEGRLGKVVKAEPVPVRARMTVAQGFAAIVAACLRHFRLNEPLVISERSPLALHQARVAMRRLRSAMSLFRTAISDSQLPQLRAELRWFTRELGDARNLDVFLESRTLQEDEALLKDRREAAYDRVISELDSQRVRTMLLDLVAWSMLGKWREAGAALYPFEPYASRRIDRLWHRISHAGDVNAMDEEERHRLRIGIKKLRYALEFMDLIYVGESERKKKFANSVEQLQEALGHLNDVVVARTLVARDDWPLEPAEPGVDETSHLKVASRALSKMRRIGPYWRKAV
ncbi:MAG TPA: CHAD domain-containing protein, partial [Sphingomicrobium sp.]|nr:CHAD domain-containing protein [Sphingomicrobium sp.]